MWAPAISIEDSIHQDCYSRHRRPVLNPVKTMGKIANSADTPAKRFRVSNLLMNAARRVQLREAWAIEDTG